MNTSSSTPQNNTYINTGKHRKHRKKSGWTPIGIAAMVFGFILAWPIGLAVLAYILWGGRVDDLINDLVNTIKGAIPKPRSSSGNAAFDDYKAATLRDLEEQQAEFADYVDQLRQARDRDEFEHFMNSKKSSKGKK